MRQATRSFCLSLPFLVVLAALVCQILVFLGNRSASSSVERSLYFLRANTSDINVSSIDVTAAANGRIADWYTIGLWNYCSGSADSDVPTFCSEPVGSYYFNPVEVWGLTNTPVDSLLPEAWADGLKTYKAVAKWLFIAYIVAIVATAVTLVVSLFAFCSRMGSVFTSMAAAIAVVFTLAASATATALYITIMGLIKEKLGNYGVHSELGHNMFVVTWLASAFILVGGLWYTLTMCCCGVDHHHDRARQRDSIQPAKTSRWPAFVGRGRARAGGAGMAGGENYQRVPSPYAGYAQGQGGGPHHVVQQSWPLQSKSQDHAQSYEPFRRSDWV